MSSIDTATLLELLQSCNLISHDQLTALRADAGTNSHRTIRQLIDDLVDQDTLTRWQGDMLLSGRRAFFLGRYKLLGLLGEGGMGAVFEAEQTPLGRKVALKVMAKRLLRDTDAVSRFHREIQAVAALNHPNIVSALDADCVDEPYFLVMEYVDGVSLTDLISYGRKLPIGLACEIASQIASGLQHAHECGMIHRDIKPGNILVCRSNDGKFIAKVLDFGLARLQS